ncbi:MAG: hypothetical protein JSW50_02865 [Candidatus Latescibacterota bacterium]|nr:MAG: hypothetical protein JSW50_02865 [Candidatus Latescibacterota bacterium]
MSKSDVELGKGWTKPKLIGPMMVVLAVVAAVFVALFWLDGRFQEALLVIGAYISAAIIAVLDMIAALIKAIQNLGIRRETGS